MFNQLQRGSFRGAEFLLRSGEVIAGRKTVAFEFPNNNFRYIEDLGQLLEVFTLTAVITGTRYKTKRDALKKALETPGIGVLVHPFLGRFNVIPDPYTLTETIGELGIATFEMVFKVASDKKFPLQTADNRSSINKFSKDVLDAASSATAAIYEVTDKFRENYLDAMDTLNNFTQALDTITEPLQVLQEGQSVFAVQINNFKDSITSSIARPALLADNIKGIFSSSSSLSEDPASNLTYATALFDFGNKFQYVPETTAARVQRNRNRRLIAQQVNVSALSNAYLNATLVNYTDEDQLDSTKALLQKQFEYVTSLEDITNENLAALRALRNQTRIVLDSLALNVNKIVQVSTNPTSITALVYQYYNGTDNDSLIMNMNNIVTPGRLDGSLRMVTTQ